MKGSLNRKMFIAPQVGDDRRSGDRRPVAEASTLRGPNDEPLDVTVGDLSVSGFNIACATPLPMGAVVQLGLPGSGRFTARVVRCEGDQYGCEFFEYLSHADVTAAFESTNVAQLFVAPDDWHGAEPKIDKWPVAVRASVAIGSALALWGAILWALLG